MSNPAEVIVLAEDLRQFNLVKRYIRSHNSDSPIRFRAMSGGHGSGEQLVRKQYVSEVRAHLIRQARKWLIVVIDADAMTVENRLRQLSQELQQSEDTRVRNCKVEAEQIARLIPKWSIETWILFLNSEQVTETTAYKRTNRNWDEMIKPASAELSRLVHRQQILDASCIPSLRRGVEELRRLTV